MIDIVFNGRYKIIAEFIRDVLGPPPTLSIVERMDVRDQQFN